MSNNMTDQFELYSLPASAFFSDEESNKEYILNKLCEELRGAEKQLEKTLSDEVYDNIYDDIIFIKQQIEDAKQELKQSIANHQGIRHLREDALTSVVRDKNGKLTDERKPNKHNIISMFPSILSRTLGIEVDTLTMDIMIFDSSYTDVLESLIKNGFMYGESELYLPYTASAGQIREEKIVFAKKKVLDRHMDSLMCGLTVDRINKSDYKGANINKYLAYLALGQSASKPWDIDLDRCIVVDDFETLVNGTVDFINRDTYDITRQLMDVPITHTDGCGMVLPSESDKNFQFRMPFFKGLMAVAPFDTFISSHEGASSKVIDIWNDERDIIEDDVRYIFVKSQFKMWKYFTSWQEYKDAYRDYGCQSGICSEDENGGNAQFGYQMLQSLTDVTDDELKYIASKTIHDINMAGSDKDTMLKTLGVGTGKQTSIQQAIALLPELAADDYSVENLKDTRRSMITRALYAKVEIDAKYTFIIPDMYAYCEKLFLGIDEPNGLLADGEVYCNLYPDNDRLLCLRSPHLHREHAVRNNMVDVERSKWFLTGGLYTSCHDLISKLLQFDVDGDDSLVCGDKQIIQIADRNMKNDDVVPLYYEMATAKAEIISNDSIFNGLVEAFKGSGNIGKYSNAISKLWNSEKPNLKVIKWLCMESNFSIDQAKTLFMPTRPDNVDKIIKQALSKELPNGKRADYKLPYFFQYAKGKTVDEIEPVNDSTVNRLKEIIPQNNIKFKDVVGKLDHKMLMSPTRRIKDETMEKKIIKQYEECVKDKLKQTRKKGVNLKLINQEIKKQLLEVCKDKSYLVDVLVSYLYKGKKSKIVLWDCFGQEIVRNIKLNKGIGVCVDCREDYVITKQRQCRCEGCKVEYERKIDAKRKREKRKVKMSV